MNTIGKESAPVRPAAAVVVARESQSGPPQLLFLKRPATMRTFSGFYVFPGGTLHPEDSSEQAQRLSVVTATEAKALLGDAAGDEPALAFFVCAIRELFEEAGILLAYEGDSLVNVGEDLLAERTRIMSGERGFLEVIEERGLTLATDRLRYRERWIAPEMLPVRFDLRVMTAALHGDVVPEDGEVESVHWHSAQEALALVESGEISLAPPTIATLNSITSIGSVDSLLANRPAVSLRSAMWVHSQRVTRLLAPNASMMTGPGSNTYVIGDGAITVIDPGSMDKSHLDSIRDLGRIERILITHKHPDHVSGAFELAASSGAEVAASRRFWEGTPLEGRVLEDGEVLDASGLELHVIATPGHSSDHLCFWAPEERALFSGDLILGEGTTVISPPDGDLIDYMESLRKVELLVPSRIYPGHFAPRDDAKEWIAYYIEHRNERERQIEAVLADGGLTVQQIVGAVYTDTPAALHPIAQRSVLAHLAKLIQEGRVIRSGDTYERAQP